MIYNDDTAVNLPTLKALADRLRKLGRNKWSGLVQTALAHAEEGDPADAIRALADVTDLMFEASSNPGRRRGKIDPDDDRYVAVYQALNEHMSRLQDEHYRAV